MKKITEERFRRKLLVDINRLCQASDKLFLERDKYEHVFDLYERYKIIMHNRIKQGRKKEQENIKLDRHKIAAIFFCAILKANPIGRKPDALKFYERTVNIQLALIFSVKYVIDLFNISDPRNTPMDKEIYELFIKFPECQYSEHKNYIVNFIMLIDKKQEKFLDLDSAKFVPNSLFIISHLFFLLDAFSYQQNRCSVIESGFTPISG